MITLASGVTLWDSGEFLSAIRSLGIPHPPGTPLYILLGKVWSMVFAPVFGFARSINLFSAVCTALGCGLLTYLYKRWTGDRGAATAGGICAGLMSTVWLSATETEVYGVALLFGMIMLVLANRSGETSDARWTVLAVYFAGLAWTLHLVALLVVPAAAYLAFTTKDGFFAVPSGRRHPDGRRDSFTASRLAVTSLFVLMIAASCTIFMMVRARHDPTINQGNPRTWAMLVDVLMRSQYDVAPLWPRQAPLWLQVGNLFEYADWQFALGLSPEAPPTIWRTPVTVAYALLGVAGFFVHKRQERRSWVALLILFLTASIGAVLYLNLKAGPSFGGGFLPPGALHEARERDYFFFFAFMCWGLWAGVGAMQLARALPGPLRLIALALPVVPAALNWPTTDRRISPSSARVHGDMFRMMDAIPDRAVFLTRGDNDTYPLWYLQTVEGERPDITIITEPMLGAKWYREEIARRHKLLDPAVVETWRGKKATMESLVLRAVAQSRPVIGSPYFDSTASR
ncbi:MAG TPA: DUF2723 domain-containing protein [Gemmatimonadaceae bacterium]|nr:DUF2723 domain-containing protein [Gemmatimonadaceae bacterium]